MQIKNRFAKPRAVLQKLLTHLSNTVQGFGVELGHEFLSCSQNPSLQTHSSCSVKLSHTTSLLNTNSSPVLSQVISSYSHCCILVFSICPLVEGLETLQFCLYLYRKGFYSSSQEYTRAFLPSITL